MRHGPVTVVQLLAPLTLLTLALHSAGTAGTHCRHCRHTLPALPALLAHTQTQQITAMDHSHGSQPSIEGTPISDWYFVLRSSATWFSKAKYCGFASGAATEGALVCDKGDPPLFSLLTLVSPSGDVRAQACVWALGARTGGLSTSPFATAAPAVPCPTPQLPGRAGRDLLLVSRTGGLCGTPPAPPPPPDAPPAPAAQQRPSSSSAPPADRQAVTCESSREQPTSTFQLVGEDLVPGAPIDLWDGKKVWYLSENGRCAPSGPAAGNAV